MKSVAPFVFSPPDSLSLSLSEAAELTSQPPPLFTLALPHTLTFFN